MEGAASDGGLLPSKKNSISPESTGMRGHLPLLWGEKRGRGLTFLLCENNFDDAAVELSAIPVLFGILRILVVEKLDEGKRLAPPASVQLTTLIKRTQKPHA